MLKLDAILAGKAPYRHIMTRKIDPRNSELIDDDLAANLRQKSPAERAARSDTANRTPRLHAAAGVRYQRPKWDRAQLTPTS